MKTGDFYKSSMPIFEKKNLEDFSFKSIEWDKSSIGSMQIF